ncbi:MAG: tRNA (N(6)-L-threonylcarbamoyladenosine(37)-C(2))-methylthiotransferase MtaB [Dehalococcoidia bacterium]
MTDISGQTNVALHTLGCKLNQAEAELLARSFTGAGYHIARPGAPAQVCVVNTCTVTHVADGKGRRLLRWLRRRNPDALVVATGCYAQRAPRELAAIDGVDVVVPRQDRGRVVEIVGEKMGMGTRRGGGQIQPPPGRSRSLVKVQEGCDQGCAYCIVPRVRGGEQSRAPREIIDQVKERHSLGAREAVLTGTQIGSYRWDGTDLAGLLGRLLRETEIPRLRLSSLQPRDLSPRLLHLWEGSRLCAHLHIPLQSGSDGVLERMGRNYSSAEFTRAVSLARDMVPNIAITTDLMVGFPGESPREFEASLRLCQELALAAIHVFPYSPRPGTRAARMPDQVDARVKKERTRRALEMAADSAQAYRAQFLGQSPEVLWEAETADGMWSGLTDNYLRVFARSPEPLAGRFIPARLVGVKPRGLIGRPILDRPIIDMMEEEVEI